MTEDDRWTVQTSLDWVSLIGGILNCAFINPTDSPIGYVASLEYLTHEQ
jgi:hypothetical protein